MREKIVFWKKSNSSDVAGLKQNPQSPQYPQPREGTYRADERALPQGGAIVAPSALAAALTYRPPNKAGAGADWMVP
jgi:hypothetical protein